VSSADTIGAALAAIDRNESELQAWVVVDRDAARMQDPGDDAPLADVPFGVKDIFDVAGLPTSYGLPPERRTAETDAWCVAALRAAGAIPIGKTHTTAFAFVDPAPTQNPLDATRTPGGSSAGSAAAVAAGHVPFALGSQTIGSTLRPAAFCGVVGFKPTFGMVPTAGASPLAPSLDHVGIIARDVAMAARVAGVLLPARGAYPQQALQLAFAPATLASRFAPETLAVLATAVKRLREAGVAIVDLTLPADVEESLPKTQTILAFEAYNALRPLLAKTLPPELHALLTRGSTVTYASYREALAWRERSRSRIESVLAGYDGVMLPLADVAPPRATTGDGVPLGPWTFWGTPAISVPVGSCGGLPISVQIVGARDTDTRVLAAGALVERTFMR